jgi:hypothetical protein
MITGAALDVSARHKDVLWMAVDFGEIADQTETKQPP